MRGARLLRRASWNLVDQMLSAGTNAVLSFVVAREVDAAGFGAFAVAFGVFSVAIGVERALVGQPWSIRHSAASPDEWRDAVGAGMPPRLQSWPLPETEFQQSNVVCRSQSERWRA